MTSTQLKIKDLWHKYPHSPHKLWTLKSIDLNLKEGELIGLLGPSGCGKTTLLRLIAGFERPSQGEIYIHDQLVASATRLLPPERRGVGMVFQDYALFPHLNAWKNVCFGLKRGQDKDRANWLLSLLGLSELSNHYPHELSGGQRQRLALARALAPGNSLVIMDEPFSNLDVDVRNRLRSELQEVLSTCSASGLLVTHDPQEALAICDRVAIMKDGQFHQCSTPTQLVHEPATPFVGRFVLQRNVLPVKCRHDKLMTPVGPLAYIHNSPIDPTMELLIDEHALHVKAHPEGDALVHGREFLGSHWLLKILVNKQLLRVWQPLEEPLKAGDRCFIKFNPGQKGILFPGAISCNLC